MTTLLWIGFGFAAFLVIFLIVVFFTKERLSDDRRQILRILSALCAGFAGGLITGDALFRLDTDMGARTKLGISGTAGFALFFAVLYSFRRVVAPADAMHFSVPNGWNFRQAVDALVSQDNAVANYVGFTPAELSAPLQARELHTKTPSDALQALRLLASTTPVREYDVDFQPPTYYLRVR